MMRLWAVAGLLLGLAVVATLVALEGYESVAVGLASLGWGIVLLPLAFLPSLLLATLSWQLLFRPGDEPGLVDLVRAEWMGFSVNVLLPLGSFGGDVVKVRVLMQAGVGGVESVASVVVGKTVEAVTLVVWGLIGIAFLIAVEADDALVGGALIASALLALGIAAFVLIQRAGVFGFLARRVGGSKRAEMWAGMTESAADIDATIRSLYGRPGRLLGSGILWLLARLTLCFELWLAIVLMGQSISLWDLIMLRSLISALRGAAFIVPGAWGLQEGGYIVIGGLIGFPPDFMLALSLATRAREFVISVPGLLAWQHLEGRALWKRHRAGRRR